MPTRNQGEQNFESKYIGFASVLVCIVNLKFDTHLLKLDFPVAVQ